MSEVDGWAILTQTCDIVRSSRKRPYLEVAPLVLLKPDQVEAVRRLKQPRYAYIPAASDKKLVADLDRVMTVEKSVVVDWQRTQGCPTDDDARKFAFAIARKRERFAFPDDFNRAMDRLRRRLLSKHDRNSDEGKHIASLREIRAAAAPSWDGNKVYVTLWLIRGDEPIGCESNWPEFVKQWSDLYSATGAFETIDILIASLDDMTVRDYFNSSPLDLDQLSVPRIGQAP